MSTQTTKTQIQTTYHVIPEIADMVIQLQDLKDPNTEQGYRLYYNIYKAVTDANFNKSILWDLTAKFAWDDRLDAAFNRIAIEEGRCDLLS